MLILFFYLLCARALILSLRSPPPPPGPSLSLTIIFSRFRICDGARRPCLIQPKANERQSAKKEVLTDLLGSKRKKIYMMRARHLKSYLKLCTDLMPSMPYIDIVVPSLPMTTSNTNLPSRLRSSRFSKGDNGDKSIVQSIRLFFQIQNYENMAAEEEEARLVEH